MAPTGDNSLVVTIVLLSLILVVVIGVFVWNITLVNRTSLVTDQYTTIVQECIADGLNADTLDHPTLAAIASERALSRLRTLSRVVGGNATLATITRFDIDKLEKILTSQMMLMLSFVKDTNDKPIAEHALFQLDASPANTNKLT